MSKRAAREGRDGRATTARRKTTRVDAAHVPLTQRQPARDGGRGADADAPRDLNAERDKLALTLMRLVAEAKELWRGCARPACRRAKTCRGAPHFACVAALKLSPLSAEDSARTAAELLQALQAQMRRRRAARAAEGCAD
jgi:hypothetical protein